jgi:lipopolysaccharide biosynthesis glycosyltransferase
MSFKKLKLTGELASFVPIKTLRHRLRAKLTTPKICLDREGPPMKKYGRRISAAFCFDNAVARQAAVAIKSLIESGRGKCDYDIFCITDDPMPDKSREMVKNIVRGTGSKLTFLADNHDFDKSWLDGIWPVSIYYRLMLPKLLPDIDRIIYADVDVAFVGDLIEADMIDMGENLIAGVISNKDAGTINSGFLIMNLRGIRNSRMYEKWVAMSRRERFKYPDQTLLRETCKNRIMYLPWKYNVMPGGFKRRETMLTHSEREYYELRYHAVMLHWAGEEKPWHTNTRPIFSEVWWKYAKQTGLF